MTLNDLIDNVTRTLGDTDNARWTPDEITRYLNDGQRILNAEAEILKTMVVLTMATAGLPGDSATAYYTLPSDVVKLKRVENAGAELERVGLTFFGNSSVDWTAEQGTPQYYLYGDYGPTLIRLYKDPGASLSALRAYYLRNPQDLTSLGKPEVPDIHHQALGFYAVSRAYTKDFEYRDPSKAQAFGSMWAEAVQRAKDYRYSVPRRGPVWSF